MENLQLDQLPITEEDYFLMISDILDVLTDKKFLPEVRYLQALTFLEENDLAKQNYRHLAISLNALVECLCRSFLIAHPRQDKPILQKKEFNDWYMEFYKKYLTSDYQGIICSACSLSLGKKEFLKSGKICSFDRQLRRLICPYLCAKITNGNWSERFLQQLIMQRHGEAGWLRFMRKKAELMNVKGIIMIEVL